jgi:predicted TIM-barrel fold metal-dependent hydrolase
MQVLDFTGVKRQLMFPGGMGLGAVVLLTFADDPNFLSGIGGDRAGYARKLIDAYNEWCVRTMAASDRTRAVAVLLGDTSEALLAEAKRLVAQGVRAVWLPSATLPGGRSPAHADLDPVYKLLTDEKVTLCAHVGADFGFYRLSGWNEAAVFKGFKAGGEFSLDPWTLCSMSRAAENYVMTMVVGGVFERHPTLRMCVAELGAEWIGPLSRRMDLWIENSGIFDKRNTDWAMTLRPSEYVNRNIRVVPFFFEDVGTYVQQFGLSDVYCYGSDYPHVEGGKNPMDKFAKQIDRASATDLDLMKFFVGNGEWILPD